MTAMADEVKEIYVPPPTAATSQTLTAQTPLPTSPIGCSTAHSIHRNSRDPLATPTQPLHDTTGSTKGGKVHSSRGGGLTGPRAGMGESKSTVNFEEKIVVSGDPAE